MNANMTSIHAKLYDIDARLVVFVTYPNIVLLDLVGPLQVFTHSLDQKTRKPGYRCAVTSQRGGMIDTNTIVSIPTEAMANYQDRDIHTLVIVGGDGAIPAMRDESLLAAIRPLAERSRRICSVCSGALVLAATGALDGRRAVTHWDDCQMLADEFPAVSVETDPIYVKDGDVWTSAGVTAGIDMALAIVTEDLGRVAALEIARSMVAQMARSGGQSQFSPTLGRQVRDAEQRFDGLHRWIADHLEDPLHVEDLAAHMNMSPRNFSRLYSRQMGAPPAKAVEAIRAEAARDMLETTDLSVKQIAARCGFRDEERMRRTFMRLMSVSPSDYRQNFKAG